MNKNLTSGSVFKNLIWFSLPYLLSCFLQTFYGLADLFITGQFNGADSISAVAIGSQLMHMLTVVIVGLAMGSTVLIGRYAGASDKEGVSGTIGSTALLFGFAAALLTAVLTLLADPILRILSTPQEAFVEARAYVRICFAGIPFITAYNIISSIFRGMGDTRRPMYFVAVAGVINIILDYLLIGPLGMGAAGAALATVISQAVSVGIAVVCMIRFDMGLQLTRQHFRPDVQRMKRILQVGVPVAFQDGLIQISFLIITRIANSRGVDVAAAVGIVEKIIGFLFLVPSAMLSSVSALAAQNIGAKEHARARSTLWYATGIGVVSGIFFTVVCQLWAPQIISMFAKKDAAVVTLGAQYLRTYVIDCIFAAVHFCFSGYFCAYGKAFYSFLHNIISIILMRIPGAYFASILFPQTLYAMGLAAPLGSLLSSAICIILYRKHRNVFLTE